MNILRESNQILNVFDKDYIKRGSFRYKLIDDSVLLVAGIVKKRGKLFDVFYTFVPLFSHFDLSHDYINNASAFMLNYETELTKGIHTWCQPANADKAIVIELAVAYAKEAYEKLQNLKTMDDCLMLCKDEIRRKTTNDFFFPPRFQHLDILIFRHEFDECAALLNEMLGSSVRNVFRLYKVAFPEDGNWVEYLPKPETENLTNFQRLLVMAANSSWKEIREKIEQKDYRSLCGKLYENYLKNRASMKTIGINLSSKADSIMYESLKQSFDC